MSLDSVVMAELTVNESDGFRSMDWGILGLPFCAGELSPDTVLTLVVLTEISSAKLKWTLDSVVMSEFTVNESEVFRSIDWGGISLPFRAGEFSPDYVSTLVVLTEISSAKLKSTPL